MRKKKGEEQYFYPHIRIMIYFLSSYLGSAPDPEPYPPSPPPQPSASEFPERSDVLACCPGLGDLKKGMLMKRISTKLVRVERI